MNRSWLDEKQPTRIPGKVLGVYEGVNLTKDYGWAVILTEDDCLTFCDTDDGMVRLKLTMDEATRLFEGFYGHLIGVEVAKHMEKIT